MLDVKLIIFDWGGTLADVSGQTEALRRASRAVGRVVSDWLGPLPASVSETLAGEAMIAEHAAAADPQHREVDLARLLERWTRGCGCEVDEDKIAAAVQAVGENWVGGLKALPGALEAVRRLRDAGYRLGVVSNCWIPPLYCDQELARQGFASLVHFAIYSSQLGYRKPAPAVYEAALRAGFPNGQPRNLSEVLFVGDSPTCDVIAPAQMGMKTALVLSPPGTWPQADLDRARPDLRVHSVAELPALLGPAPSS